MSKRGEREPPLALDMDFDEALRRFGKTNPDELPEDLKPKRLKKGTGSKEPDGP